LPSNLTVADGRKLWTVSNLRGPSDDEAVHDA
jgi:hypothetical protein